MRLNTEKYDLLKDIIEKRILVLDGAMGSLLLSNYPVYKSDEKFLPDVLVKKCPEIIKNIHRAYLQAGADIIKTNSFNSNRISLADYCLHDNDYNLSFKAARLAKEAVDEFMNVNPGKHLFVAGSVGPAGNLLSLAQQTSRNNYETLVSSYSNQIIGLLDGGADIILIETVCDNLSAAAVLYAVSRIEEERKYKIPVIVTATVTDSSGRLPSGQTLEAFYEIASPMSPLAVGVNCGFGSSQFLPVLRKLAVITGCAVCACPNAGLPDDSGQYPESEKIFGENIKNFLLEGLINIIGGCCGTTPSFIREITALVREFPPHPIQK